MLLLNPIKRLIKFSPAFAFTFSTEVPPSSSFNPFDVFDIGPTPSFKGSLVIIPTPIGNLRDLSLRQYDFLLAVDIIACEDTRTTGLLLNLIKKKGIKDQMATDFGVELKDLKDEQIDEADLMRPKGPEDRLKAIKEEEKEVKEMVAEKVPGMEVKDFEQRKRMREELRIKAIKTKAKRILEGVDSLSFMRTVETETENEEDLYGLEDEFLGYLKKKVAESREKKGRGLLLSYYKHNEEARIGKLIKAMKYGFKVGLVCDAGTPTISDPGYKLVDATLKEGIIVEALPGPNSIAVALSLSGFPSDSFSFEGYFSKNQDERLKKLMKSRESMTSCVFFENVQRLEKTLISIEKVFGPNQQIFLALELTKLHQKTYRKTVKEMIDFCHSGELTYKGELTMIIPPYLKKFNKDVVTKGVLKEEEMMEVIKGNLDDKKDKVFAKDEKILHEVNENSLMEVLDERFQISDKQMAEVLEDILKVSQTRSMHLVRRFRAERSRRSSKFFDPSLFKYVKP